MGYVVVAEAELDRFLAELNARRRLLSLAGPSGSAVDADMLAELAELAEQLVVADAELRAQHEELEAARESLLRSQASYEHLLAETSTAYLLTDEHGIMGQLNPAAEALLGRSVSRQRTSRPLATTFAVSDRGRIRTVLSEIKRSGGEPASCRAKLVQPNGELVEVDVTARLVAALPRDGTATLSWQLRPVPEARRAELHSVPVAGGSTALGSTPGEPSRSTPGVLAELSTLATVLADQHSAQDVLDQAVFAASQALPGGVQASISLVDKDGNLQTPSSTGELATACDGRSTNSVRVRACKPCGTSRCCRSTT
jgi:PAS domain-containing protein